MAKKLFIALLAVAACAGCYNEPEHIVSVGESSTATFSQEQVIAGVLRIKLAANVEGFDAETFSRTGTGSGIAALDAATTRVGAVAATRIFSDGEERFRTRRSRAGLDRWYSIHFDPSLPVAEAIRLFGNMPEIECIEPAYRIVPIYAEASSGAPIVRSITGNAFNDPNRLKQWAYRNEGNLSTEAIYGIDINVMPVWDVCKGDPSVIVAVNDGGIDYEHPDLMANMWDDGKGHCGYNFKLHSYEIIPDAHGTMCAGMIGAVNNNGIGICGIAGGDGTPNSGVKLQSCQTGGPGDYPDIEEYMAWSADNGAVISQHSWSYADLSDLSQAGKDAIDYFIENAGYDENGIQTGPMGGGIVVFAAGNNNVSTPQFPAAYPPCIAVGAIGIDGKKASFSNYGDWVDIVAPGVDIYTTLYDEQTGDHIYGYTSGTSIACPIVSGVAALAVSALGTGNKRLTAERLRRLIIDSGRKKDIEYLNPDYVGMMGSGLIDAEYIVFSNAVPESVKDVKTASSSDQLTLTFAVPRAYGEQAVRSFDVYVSDEEFSAETVEAIPATAAKYTFTNSRSAIGHDFTCKVGKPAGSSSRYSVAVVACSKYGKMSAPCIVNLGNDGDTSPDGETAAISLSLYPNPCRNLLNVRVGNGEGEYGVYIYNAAAQKVLAASGTLPSDGIVRIDTSRLTAGTYTCTVECNGTSATKHMIKR